MFEIGRKSLLSHRHNFVFVRLQEDAKTMKTKMREKVRPKMGKIDIDYQKLHDAFFKWQIKPKLTIHGDLYYEVQEAIVLHRSAAVRLG